MSDALAYHEIIQPLVTFADLGKVLGGKSSKTIGRWIQTVAGFPQPVRVGCSRLFLREEIEAYVERLKQKRASQKNQI